MSGVPMIHQAAVRTGQTSPNLDSENGSQAEVTLLSTKGGTYSVKGVLSTTVAPDVVYSILLDYDRSHKIFTNIKESAVEVDEKGQRVLNQVWFSAYFRPGYGQQLTNP